MTISALKAESELAELSTRLTKSQRADRNGHGHEGNKSSVNRAHLRERMEELDMLIEAMRRAVEAIDVSNERYPTTVR